jgi:hypothetical protein
MIINDGTGTGNQAQVDITKRLRTRSVSSTEPQEAAREGLAYNINTGTITLTSASESSVLYVKNNETNLLHLEAIAVGLDRAVGSTSGDMVKITLIRNPTAGTVVSDATAVDMNHNRNFGSTLTLTTDVYKGGEAKTLTDGSDIAQFFASPSSRLFADITFMLPRSQSVGIKIDPPSGTTSMNCYVALICHLENGSI